MHTVPYTLPCPGPMTRRGGSYDAVDTIDVQAPCWVALQHDTGSAEDTPAKDFKLETRFVRLERPTVAGPHNPKTRGAPPRDSCSLPLAVNLGGHGAPHCVLPSDSFGPRIFLRKARSAKIDGQRSGTRPGETQQAPTVASIASGPPT
jgi:hypothetical protein